MASLTIKTNPSQSTDVVVGDAGIEVPALGNSVTIESLEALLELAESNDLVELCQDDAFGAGQSTLVLNDGTSDIDQSLVDEFLSTVFLTRQGEYAALVSNDQGDYSLPADNVTYDNATSGLAATELQSAVDELAASGPGGIDETEHRELDTLVHWLAEDVFTEVSYDAFFRVTNITSYTDNTKTTKVREEQATYIGLSRRLSQRVIIQYDETGSEVETLTTTYTYTGLRIISSTTVRA